MLQINEFNHGVSEMPVESVTVTEPPPPTTQKSCRQLLLVLGYQSRQEKLLPFILEENQKQEYQRTLGESGRKVNT